MSDNIENHTHALLNALRDDIKKRFDRVDEKLDLLVADVQDLKARTTNTEEGLAGVNRRLDRIDERVMRIEKRLNLVEA